MWKFVDVHTVQMTKICQSSNLPHGNNVLFDRQFFQYVTYLFLSLFVIPQIFRNTEISNTFNYLL